MRILVAGDFSPKQSITQLILSEEYRGKFNDIIKLTKSVDFAIVNFESNVSTPDSKPIEKNGPNLTTIPQALKLVSHMGFNVVTLANNHFYDYGDSAVDNTIALLDAANIKHVGGGRNIKDASKTLFLTKGEETIAIINACEHEFSIADKNHGGSYGIDLIKIYHDIQNAKAKADYILVIIHGGHEHFQLPSLRMQDWYRFFIDVGADAVANHHQHCFSGMEVYRGKPIYYGLGNFFFDSVESAVLTEWNKGILLGLNFSNGKVDHYPIPYIQCPGNPSVELLKDDDENFKNKFKELNSIIANREELSKCNAKFYSSAKRNLLSIFQPYWGKYLSAAYRRGFLPSVITKKKRYKILNMIECESHLDKLRFLMNTSKP